MKKLFFIWLLALCATTQTNAQLRDTTLNMNMHKVDANSPFLKSKKQKTTGFILLGGGAALVGVAIAIGTADPVGSILDANDRKEMTNTELFLASGGVVMLSSIPFFIASGKNKRKAELMLKDQAVYFNPQLNIKEHLVAVGMKINL